jgi:hypothetical protein
MISNAVWGRGRSSIEVTFDNGTVLWVPDDMRNSNRQELAAWEEVGGVIAPYVAPLPTAEEQRIAAIKADPAYIDLFNRAHTATAAQIDAWFAANVTTLVQARGVLAAIVKLMATNL